MSTVTSKLLNPYQRFTKIQLNQQGYKLAFIDNNFLSFLTNIIDQPDAKKQVYEIFEKNKIKPVLNSFVFYEFTKGLQSSSPTSLFIKKKDVSQFLDELKAIWIQDYVNILAFELLHTCEGIKNNAHTFYHIYSSCPLGVMSNPKPFTEKGSCSYECDEVMPYHYSPYSDNANELSNPVSDWLSYFEHVIKSLNELDDIKSILDTTVQNYEKLCKDKSKIKKDEEIRYNKNKIEKIIEPLVGCRFSSGHKEYICLKTTEIYNSIKLDWLTSPVLDYAPLYIVSNHFYWHTLKNWDTKKNIDKKRKDILDELHAQMALSYCDYLITEDKPITRKCNSIGQKLNLQFSTLNYKNLFDFILN